MLNEKVKQRLIREIYAGKEFATVKDLNYVLDILENDSNISNISDLDRRIAKLRIIEGMKYRDISRILDLEKEHTVPNRFKSTMRYLRKQLRIHNRPNDGTEQLSEILRNKNDILKLSRHGIYTIGQFIEILKEEDLLINTAIVSSIVYTLELNGHKDLRSIIKNRQVLEDLEDLDRRNYVHVDQLQDLIARQKLVDLVERATNSYTISSKTEFGSFDVLLSNGSKVRLRATIKPLECYYELSTDVESSQKYERFDYSEKMTHSVSTKSENLEEALQFLLLAASTD